jgi:hypothetical protein
VLGGNGDAVGAPVGQPGIAAHQHVERPGQRADVAWRDEQSGVADHLLHGRAAGRYQGRGAGQRLEGGQPEPLFLGGVGERGGAAQQRRDRLVGHVSRADDAVAVTRRRDRRRHVAYPPAVRPGQHELQLRIGPGHAVKGTDEERDGLAWLDRADEGDERGADTEPFEQRRVGGVGWRSVRVLVRRVEALVVNAVRDDVHGRHRSQPFAQSGGRGLADADEGGGPMGGDPDGPTKELHLGSLVPLRVLEER